MSSESEHTGIYWVHSEGAWGIAAIGAFIGIGISLYNIIKHIIYYTLPEQQLHIIRIIIIVPLYAIVSWLSMGFPSIALYFESIRDIYEAFVIYCFLILILGYVGGEANCINLISLKPPLKHPFPLCCLPSMDLNVKFLRFCKLSCIQFIIVKPIMAILNILVLAFGDVDSLGYRIFASAVYNICYTLALYGLLLFYLACKEDIRAYSPVRKFFAVKIIIFATYWQSLIVAFGTPGLDKETADLWNDFILCIESAIFAFVHLYSFPWWEFKTGMPSSKELVAQNTKAVLSFKDVVRDVYHNVAPKYQTYVLQSDDGTTKQYKTKTFMVGNLNDPKKSSKFMPNMAGLKKKYGNNDKFEKGFGQKKNYVQHTDEEEYGPEITETELDYDPRMVHHHDPSRSTGNEDTESHDTQPEDDRNGLALSKKKITKTITDPDSNYDDDDEEVEEDDDDEYNGNNGVNHNNLNSNGMVYMKSGSGSKSDITPDSKTNLIHNNNLMDDDQFNHMGDVTENGDADDEDDNINHFGINIT